MLPKQKKYLLQVWVIPKQRNIEPRYDQRTFEVSERQNKWQIVVSLEEKDHALWINQDTEIALTNLQAGKEITYSMSFQGNGLYIFVNEGAIRIEGESLGKRDGCRDL